MSSGIRFSAGRGGGAGLPPQRTRRGPLPPLARLPHLAANVADPAGEIDLIALDRNPRHRRVPLHSGDNLERTTASVDHRKQKKITDAATRFLAPSGLAGPA